MESGRKVYNGERVIRKILSDGELHLRKEYENTRRKSVIVPYKLGIYLTGVDNLHEINKRALKKRNPFSVEVTEIRGEFRFEYL